MTRGTTAPAVRLERVIPAAPHDVYRAWLDPERLDDLAAGLPHVADRVEAGWALVLEQLTATLGAC